jgi:hypothetical protein
MITDLLKKIFTNKETPDIPFPEVVPHSHNSVDSPPLAPSSVGGVNIKPGAIGDANLADFSVTEQKLADAAVATDKIKEDAVTAAKVWKGGSVITLSAQIADATILSAHIGALQVGNSKIANAAISTAKIQDAAITTAEIEDAAVKNAKIGALEVGNSRIANASISTAKIQDLAVTDAEIASLNAGKIDAGIMTGRTVRTASSGARVQMSGLDNRFEVYNSTTLAGYIQTYSDNIGIISGINYQIIISATNYVWLFDCRLDVDGDLNVGGVKDFKIPHPLHDDKWLVYTSIESNGVFLDIHGEAVIKNHKAKVDFPLYHPSVTSGIPVIQLTKVGWFGDLYVESADDKGFTIATQNAPDGAKVNWYARSVRKGYEDSEVEPLLEEGTARNEMAFLSGKLHPKNKKLYKTKDIQDAQIKLNKKKKEIEDLQKSVRRSFKEKGE